FFSTAPPTPHISPLSLHDALPIFALLSLVLAVGCGGGPPSSSTPDAGPQRPAGVALCYTALADGDSSTLAFWSAFTADDRASRRSEEHTSELQSLTHLVCRLLLQN